jgi:hypothetical protein
VNTGEVVAGDVTVGQRLVTGDTVNVPPVSSKPPAPAKCLLGDLTYRLVGDAVEVEAVAPLDLKGKASQCPPTGCSDSSTPNRRSDGIRGPSSAESGELGALLGAFSDAVATGRCRLATVFGSPGMGKSRLAEEVVAQVSRAAVIARGAAFRTDEESPSGRRRDRRKAAGSSRGSAGLARAKIADLARTTPSPAASQQPLASREKNSRSRRPSGACGSFSRPMAA